MRNFKVSVRAVIISKTLQKENRTSRKNLPDSQKIESKNTNSLNLMDFH